MTLEVKSSPANVGDAKDAGSTLGQEDPLEGAWQPTAVFLPGASQGQGSLARLRRVGHDGSNLALRFFDGNLFL